MQLFLQIEQSILENSERNAFFINSVPYNYWLFANKISSIRYAIATATNQDEKNIGLVANDDIETYAAIIALWLEGKAYVPVNPDFPKERNENIFQQAFLKTIIDSSTTTTYQQYKVIKSKELPATPINLTPKEVSNNELAYILFTSGTTGQPKGVPITRANVEGFVTAFYKIGFEVTSNDRCLQMFDLTFDLSVMSYLIPILNGCCIYTIPKEAIKFSYIYELLEEQEITIALMVPSTLQYLRPYFKEINLPYLRYSLFCGEALPLDIANEWCNCLPIAKVVNVYGPTECTIFCTHFTLHKKEDNKSYSGLVSIGKSMYGTNTIIVDDNNKILPNNSTGELCLGGVQLTPGYWNNPVKNEEAFFVADYMGNKERFYKTGDLCKLDEQGDILYIGRTDYQVKIQGFRVELSEIEFNAKVFLKTTNLVAIAYQDKMGNTEVGLVIEAAIFDVKPLKEYLKLKLPVYMLPKEISFIQEFPLNNNGKTDRNKLKEYFKAFSNE